MQDVPPFVLASGNDGACRPAGINVEGLKRRGFSAIAISALRDAYKSLYRRGLTLDEACIQFRSQMQAEPEAFDVLQTLLEFVESSRRGIIRP